MKLKISFLDLRAAKWICDYMHLNMCVKINWEDFFKTIEKDHLTAGIISSEITKKKKKIRTCPLNQSALENECKLQL